MVSRIYHEQAKNFLIKITIGSGINKVGIITDYKVWQK